MSYDNPSTVTYDDVWIDGTSTLQGSWIKYSDSNYGAARYARVNGIVYIHYMVQGGGSSSVALLPAGYRPIKQILTDARAWDLHARCDIQTNGYVVVTGWHAGWTSIFTSFVAEQ